jgi:DNA-binding response OmpR family regulator
MEDQEKKLALVMDDEESIRNYVAYVLGAEGYDVTICDNGKEGMRYFNSRKYSVVVTDIVMPEKDGIDSIIEMRRVFPRVPILAISGVGSSETLFKIAGMFSVDGVLKKPFTRREFLDSLDKAITACEETAGKPLPGGYAS